MGTICNNQTINVKPLSVSSACDMDRRCLEVLLDAELEWFRPETIARPPVRRQVRRQAPAGRQERESRRNGKRRCVKPCNRGRGRR